VHLVGLLYEIYHNARSHERKYSQPSLRVRYFSTFWHNKKVMYNSLYKELVSKTASPFCLGFARERVKRRFFFISEFPRGQQNTYCPQATGSARLYYIIHPLTPRSSRWFLSCRSSPPKPCTYLYTPHPSYVSHGPPISSSIICWPACVGTYGLWNFPLSNVL